MSRCEIEQPQVHLPGPGGDVAVVPLVGRDEEVARLAADAEALHLPEVGLQVGAELVPPDQRLFAVLPGAVEQVLVRMRAQVVPVGGQAADEVRELRRAVEIAGEEEPGPDAGAAQGLPDGRAAVGERAAGEDEGQAPGRRVAADDAVVVAGEDPAGIGRGRGASPAPGGRQERPQGQGRERTGPGRPDHFSAARTFQPRILTTGVSPARSSVTTKPEIFRDSPGSSVT